MERFYVLRNGPFVKHGGSDKVRRILNCLENFRDCYCYTSFRRVLQWPRPVRVHLNVAAIVYASPLRDAGALGRWV